MENMLGKKIIGTWELVSWTYVSDDGTIVDYLGKSPAGILHYSPDGLMCVQIMKSGRRKFSSGDLMSGTQDEINEAFESFFAYFGTFEENEPGVLTHNIQGSNFPNWTGTAEIRQAKIIQGCLVLSAPSTLPDNKEVVFKVKWKKP